MHILFQITLHVLQHALRDVQALHVDHNLTNSLVFVGLLLVFLATALLRLLRLSLRSSVLTIDLRCCRVERLFRAVRIIIFIFAHDCVVNFSNSFKDNTTELTLALCILTAHKAEDFNDHSCRFFGQLRQSQRLAHEAEHLAAAHFVRVVECLCHMQHLLDDKFPLHRVLISLLVLLGGCLADRFNELVQFAFQ